MKKRFLKKLFVLILTPALLLASALPSLAHETTDGEAHETTHETTHEATTDGKTHETTGGEAHETTHGHAAGGEAASNEAPVGHAGHWAAGVISKWGSSGFAAWHDENGFRPNDSITGEEFLSLIAAISHADTSAHEGAHGGAVTRQAAAKVVALALNLDANAESHALRAFGDAATIDTEYAPYLAAAVHAGYFSGYGNGNIGARDELTRAQALALFDRIAESGTKSPGAHIAEITTNYEDLWETAELIVEAGVPVRWYVYAAPGSLPSGGMDCEKTIKIPGLGWGSDSHNKNEGHITLKEGKNFVYEFTPAAAGDILFTCWMGSGCHANHIRVTAGENAASSEDAAPSAPPAI